MDSPCLTRSIRKGRPLYLTGEQGRLENELTHECYIQEVWFECADAPAFLALPQYDLPRATWSHQKMQGSPLSTERFLQRNYQQYYVQDQYVLIHHNG